MQNVQIIAFSRTLRDFIVVCVLCTYRLFLRSPTSLSPSLSHCCWWFTCNKLAAFVCVVVVVDYVYGFSVKRWYAVSIFRNNTITNIISQYNPLVKITTQLFTAFMLCVLISYMNSGDLQFKQHIFEKLLIAIFIFSQIFCQISVERKSPKKYVLIFRSVGEVWDLSRGLADNRPTHYLLDQADYIKSAVMLPVQSPLFQNLHIWETISGLAISCRYLHI